jgi:hypothetical protein
MLRRLDLVEQALVELDAVIDNPGCGAAPAASSTLPKVVSDRFGGHCCSSQSRRSCNSACLIGAGYMIFNEAGYMIVKELALTPAGCGVNPHSRWPCGPDPSSSRSPTRARGILVSPRLEVRRERCTAFSAKDILPMPSRNQQ